MKGRTHRPASRTRARLALEALEDRCLLTAGLYDPTHILVTFENGGTQTLQTVAVADGQSVEDAVAAYCQTPGVVLAEPDYVLSADTVPNDSSFGSQYALNNTGQSSGTVDADIDAPEAWNYTTGNSSTVVSVIDTGVDYTHPDLYLNIWINQAEIPSAVGGRLTDIDGDGLITFWDLRDSRNQGSGKITDLNGNGRIDGGDILKPVAQGGWADGTDADREGHVDDLIGWDFANNDNNPMDDVGHGTHVSGTIGAIGNNGVGVTGVNWRVSLMPLKFLTPNNGLVSDAVAAINYAVAHGVRLSNNSWGGGGFSSSLYSAINNARSRGHIFVAAAGNESTNNDVTTDYPSGFGLDNIVAVAASDRRDALASFSNYGARSVDLAAPGVSILNTTPNNNYSLYSGTSMATPHVTGTLALMLAANPRLTYSQAITDLLGSVDPVPGLSGRVATGGRLNAARAVRAALGVQPPGGGDTPVHVDLIAVGTGPGQAPVVQVFNADGSYRFGIVAYTPGFLGGINVATGDLTGDGVDDIITAVGGGAGPHVKAFDGVTGALLYSFYAYSPEFLGGVFVATGDIDGDGRADIVTGTDLGNSPHVKVFSGANGAEIRSFLAYAPGFIGGVRVAAGDIDGDGRADIITGAGTGAGPHVQVFSGLTGNVLRSFYAYSPTFSGGVTVAAGDIDGDGRAEIITGVSSNAGPHVKVFRAADLAELRSFFAFDPGFNGGVSVGAADMDGDGLADIVAGMRGGTPLVRAFRGVTLAQLNAFYAFDPSFQGGVRIG